MCGFIIRKKLNMGLYSDIYNPVSFKVNIMIEITRFYIFISVLDDLHFIQGHSRMGNQKLWCPFSRKTRYRFGCNSICCHDLLVCRRSC